MFLKSSYFIFVIKINLGMLMWQLVGPNYFKIKYVFGRYILKKG